MSSFTIDFFELLFLAEACIPPRPIARAMFWHDLIDKHYDAMTEDERLKFFKFLEPQLDLENEDCALFYARFNPENQYLVTAKTTHEIKIRCFKFKEKYHTSIRKSVYEAYIIKVEHLPIK